jgi:hypothetical protein
VLQPIECVPGNVIALRAEGKVSAEDYQSVLAPAVARVRASGTKVRLLLELGDDFNGYDLGGMFSDAKMGMDDFNSFEKLALVTDNDIFRATVETFARFMPAAAQVFGVADLETAKSWVSS